MGKLSKVPTMVHIYSTLSRCQVGLPLAMRPLAPLSQITQIPTRVTCPAGLHCPPPMCALRKHARTSAQGAAAHQIDNLHHAIC